MRFIFTFTLFILLIVHPGYYQVSTAKTSDSLSSLKSRHYSTGYEGLYVGLEPIRGMIDPSRPKWKWYHLSYLRIENDSVFLDQNPVSIYKKDTIFSASDGAFYYYKGIFEVKDSLLNLKLKLDHCDYCAHRVRRLKNGALEEVNTTKELIAKIKSNGLEINNFFFKKMRGH